MGIIPTIIGITGGSGSGKTTLAQAVAQAKVPSIVISLDYYYKDQAHLPFEVREVCNYDAPEALEFDLLERHLDQILKGKVVSVPTYDFGKHTRAAEILEIPPHPLIIIEGILLLHSKALRKKLALSVFVDTSENERFKRRLERDIKERGRTVESVHEQWHATVRPMHDKHCAPTKAVADIIISGEESLESGLERVLTALDKLQIEGTI